MKLSIKNIGKIKEANVEINGITVIAGENNTGKSTIGKSLYAIFCSFYDIEEKIEIERKNSVRRLVSRIPIMIDTDFLDYEIPDDYVGKVSDDILLCRERILSNEIDIKDIFVDSLECGVEEGIEIDDDFISELAIRLKEVLSVTKEDLLKLVLEKRLIQEFYGQVSNIFTENEGSIILGIKNDDISVSIKNNTITNISNKKNISLHTEAIYIDDPFILDDISAVFFNRKYRRGFDHRTALKYKLKSRENSNTLVDEIIAKDKLQGIYDKINTVCSGEVMEDGNIGLIYRRKNTDKDLNVENLSTGLKTFVILKMLLEKGIIERNGTFILDEPEIHLHPEWQLLFAEIIVLIQKEFGVHILLNTHSPYFLNAIEVYSVKYGINSKCKYYLARTENDLSVIEDVTNNIEKIYQKLARPLQVLENEV